MFELGNSCPQAVVRGRSVARLWRVEPAPRKLATSALGCELGQSQASPLERANSEEMVSDDASRCVMVFNFC